MLLYLSQMTPLMPCSTAEVSTGLVCVCIPALGVLARPRGQRRSTNSTLKGGTNFSSRKRGPSTDEQNLVEKGDLELQSRDARTMNSTCQRPP